MLIGGLSTWVYPMLKKWIAYQVLVFLFGYTISLPAIGGDDRELKTISNRLKGYFETARALIEYKEVANKEDNVRVRLDLNRAREYLGAQQREMHSYYSLAKSYLKDEFNANSVNALYIVCLTNSMLKWFGLNEFDNNQIYYEQIKKNELIPSPWVLDDVIGPLISEQNSISCWQKQGRGEKLLQAIDFFSIAKEK